MEKGRLAGLFHKPTFKNFVSLLLGLVSKGNTGKFRVIHDPFSPSDQSVNSNISKENDTVQYDSIDNIAYLMQDVKC